MSLIEFKYPKIKKLYNFYKTIDWKTEQQMRYIRFDKLVLDFYEKILIDEQLLFVTIYIIENGDYFDCDIIYKHQIFKNKSKSLLETTKWINSGSHTFPYGIIHEKNLPSILPKPKGARPVSGSLLK